MVANRERQAPLAGGQDGEEDLKERRFTQEVEVVEEVVVGGEEEPAEERLPVGLLAGPANPKPQHEKMPEVTDPASRTKLQVSKKKKKSFHPSLSLIPPSALEKRFRLCVVNRSSIFNSFSLLTERVEY